MSYYFASVLTNFRFLSDLTLLLNFLNIVRLLLEYCILFGGKSFSFLSSPLFCKRCVYVFDFCILKWVFLGPWEFLWRAESCIYFVCVSPLCGVPGRYTFIWALWWCGRRDCTDFPFSLALQWRVRYGWNGEGGGLFFLCFLQFAVSFLGGLMSAVGILCYIYIFSLVALWYFLAVSYFTSCWYFNNLLQVVSSQSGLRGGSGASAWADATRASEGWFGDSHWIPWGWCRLSPKRLPVPEWRGQEGRYVRHDLWLGQWDCPAEVRAGHRERLAVFVLDGYLD